MRPWRLLSTPKLAVNDSTPDFGISVLANIT
jgi:hypothetical protein